MYPGCPWVPWGVYLSLGDVDRDPETLLSYRNKDLGRRTGSEQNHMLTGRVVLSVAQCLPLGLVSWPAAFEGSCLNLKK